MSNRRWSLGAALLVLSSVIPVLAPGTAALAASPVSPLCQGLSTMYAGPAYLSQHWPSFPLLPTRRGSLRVLSLMNDFTLGSANDLPGPAEAPWQFLKLYVEEQRNLVSVIDQIGLVPSSVPQPPALLAVAASQQASLVSAIRAQFATLAPIAAQKCAGYDDSSSTGYFATWATQVAMNDALTHHRSHPTLVDFAFAIRSAAHLMSVSRTYDTAGTVSKVAYDVATATGEALVCTQVPAPVTHQAPTVVAC